MIGKNNKPNKSSYDKPAYDKPTTVICKDTKIETAKLTSSSNVQISGEFIGDLDVSASIVVGETGFIKGNVKADHILVAGKIQGNIDASHQLHITQTADVKGDIEATTIVIDEGAHLIGGVRMREVSAPSRSRTQIKDDIFTD